jgi:hypothetical protein
MARILRVALPQLLQLGHRQQRLGIGIPGCPPIWSSGEGQRDRGLLFRNPELHPPRGATKDEKFSARVPMVQRLTFRHRRLNSDRFTMCK